MLQVILSVLGRILLCAIFLAAAAGDIMKFEDTTTMVKMRLPIPDEHPEFAKYALIGAIVFSILGSLLVITGFGARFGALLLFVFLVPASVYFHDFWNQDDPTKKQQQTVEFLKNLALMGAMLFILANGAGAGRLGGRQAEAPKGM